MVSALEGPSVSSSLRRRVLGSALVATLAATAWLASRPDDDADVSAVSPARHATPTASVLAVSPASATTAGERLRWAAVTADQLAAWQPPPPPAPAAPPATVQTVVAPPPPLAAPTPPYQMIGRVVDAQGGQAVEVALLSSPNKTMSARSGDVIDGQWRVEQVSLSGVRLTWLPGQLPQDIVFKAVP